jgi:phosphopantetheinyl transferase
VIIFTVKDTPLPSKSQMNHVRLESPEIQRFQPATGVEYALLDLDEFAAARGLTAKREIERQAALHVVRTVLQQANLAILYEESGRPFLSEGPFISISHSYNKLAMLFSHTTERVGIDIEKVREKILSIKGKFLSEEELEALEGAPVEQYTLYWCAKEAVYKAAGISGLIFAEQLLVEPFSFSAQGGNIILQLRTDKFSKVYRLAYHLLDNFALVYTIND